MTVASDPGKITIVVVGSTIMAGALFPPAKNLLPSLANRYLTRSLNSHLSFRALFDKHSSIFSLHCQLTFLQKFSSLFWQTQQSKPRDP